MTKTNKTLLCALLALVLTLACALTIMPTVTTVHAAEKVYRLVTDATTLKAGDIILLGCSKEGTLAGSMGTGKYFTSVQGSFSADSTKKGEAIEITLGGTESAWTFTTSEGLIGTKGAKALNVKGDGTTTWTITIEKSIANITSTNSSYGTIKYNTANPRFLNYASGQTDIEIYRLVNEVAEEHTHATTDSWIHMVAANENATCQNPGHGEYYTCDKCEGKYFVLTDGALTETTAEALFTTVDHKYTYTANNDGTHKVGCENCDYAVANEACTYNEENKCEKCGAEKPAVPSYKKVTEAPADWSGTYILVYENKNQAYISNGQGTANQYNTATITDGVIEDSKNVFVKLLISSFNSGYSVKLVGGTNDGKYFTCESTGSLPVTDAETELTVSLDSTGVVISNGNNKIRYNSSSKMFRCYASGQQPVQLYKLVPGAHEHVEGDGIVTKAATCKENGEMTYKCTICGEVVRTDVIAKTTEHSYNDGEITTAATCTATGVKTFTCTVCGETKTQEIEALGHDYSIFVEEVAATCKETGVKVMKCSRCDEKDYQEIALDPNAHDWNKTGTDNGDGTHTVTCKNDGTHTNIVEHSYVDEVCSVCGAKKPATEDKFAIVESIAAGENTVEKDGILYVKDGSRVIVTYTITANSGVDVIEATLKQNAKFTFVSMTAGTLNNASATVTGTDVESAVKKIVVTAEKGGFAQSNVVLMTVVYELATGVAENEIPEFGIELTVLNGNTELAADKVTFTAHQTKFVVRSSELPAITVNGKTSSEEIHLTYKGEAYTSSDFAIAGRTDTPTIEWTDVANAGNYTLTLKFADNGTYGEQTVTFTVVIDKVALKASDFEIKLAEGASLTKKLVSGSVSWSEADFAVTIAEGKLVGSDTLATIGGLDGTGCTLTEARSQTLTVEFILLSDNYTLDVEVSKQFTVTAEKTDLTFGGIAIADNASKYYDGNTENVGTITVSDGSNVIEAVVNVTITKDGAAVNEILHAGKYVITIATALTDEQKKDYEDISTTINYTINKLTIVGITFAYDGNVVTWAATKCYGESADALVDLVAAGDVVYKVNGETVSEYKIVADGSARNYTVTLEATEDYILSDEVKTATTVDVHTVTFVDEKHTNVSKYVFDGQKVTADTPATVDGWTFNGWFADGAETAYDFSKITADVSVVARWTASVTLTVKDVYQGKTFDKQNTLTTVGGTLLGEVSGLAEMQINASWLKLEGYYSDEQCTTKVTTVANQTNVTIYAKYEPAIGLGDVDGDGNVGNSDIVLYRQYIVGGYKITVVEAGKEYEEASKTLAEGYVRFFAAVANVDGVEDSANDIRDIATLRMAMVEQDGYKVVGGAVVAPEKADSGNAEAQAVNTKIENRIYALLPATFGVGKAA